MQPLEIGRRRCLYLGQMPSLTGSAVAAAEGGCALSSSPISALYAGYHLASRVPDLHQLLWMQAPTPNSGGTPSPSGGRRAAVGFPRKDAPQLQSHQHPSCRAFTWLPVCLNLHPLLWLQASTPNSGVTPSPSGGRWGSRSSRKKKALSMRECTSIVDGLKMIYFTKVGLAIRDGAPVTGTLAVAT